jgi:hypothetical protein
MHMHVRVCVFVCVCVCVCVKQQQQQQHDCSFSLSVLAAPAHAGSRVCLLHHTRTHLYGNTVCGKILLYLVYLDYRPHGLLYCV